MNAVLLKSKKEVFNLKENEEFDFLIESKKSEDIDQEININLIGDNSIANLKGRIFAENKNTKKFNIKITTKGKNQKINIELKGIADGNAKISFNGGAIIGNTASGSNVEVLQKIILFSEKATGTAIPVLDVKTHNLSSASHSASISPFEKEKIFYLESRGISEKKAKGILLEGFLK